jgi:hypothetical protein
MRSLTKPLCFKSPTAHPRAQIVFLSDTGPRRKSFTFFQDPNPFSLHIEEAPKTPQCA